LELKRRRQKVGTWKRKRLWWNLGLVVDEIIKA